MFGGLRSNRSPSPDRYFLYGGDLVTYGHFRRRFQGRILAMVDPRTCWRELNLNLTLSTGESPETAVLDTYQSARIPALSTPRLIFSTSREKLTPNTQLTQERCRNPRSVSCPFRLIALDSKSVHRNNA